jgi:hypothetical protein
MINNIFVVISIDLAGFSKSLSTMGYSHFFRKTKKKKFCFKCFDLYIKSCAFAMRSCSTKYGSKKNEQSKSNVFLNSTTIVPSCTAEYHGVLTLILY